MYQFTVPSFIRGLEGLLGQLDKAAQYADHKKFDTSAYLTDRIAPDMYPFTKQIQLVSDFAKGTAARLAGQASPKFEDTETTLGQLQERVAKTITYLKTLKPSDYEGWETRKVEISWMKGKYLPGLEYATQIGLPNFYFHLTTAYNLLRSNGVDVGKSDFMGKTDEPRAL